MKNGLPSVSRKIVVANSSGVSCSPMTSMSALTPSRSRPRSSTRSNSRLAAQHGQRVGERVATIEVDVAIRPEDQETVAVEVAGEVLQEQQRRLVGPVQVVEHEHHGLSRPRVVRNVVTPSNRRSRSASPVERRATAAGRRTAGAAPTRASRPRTRCTRARRAARRRARARVYVRSASTNGRYGTPTSPSYEWPQHDLAPRTPAYVVASSTSRVLPMPGSPTTSTSRARPATA